MDIKSYLALTGESQHSFAKRVGISQPAISMYVSGLRIPKRPILKKLAAATEGKVTAADFHALALARLDG